ncbi:MAG TPA: arylamine N-acetyltransferase [Planctomycetota bacterium]|nr:arylamine N-acetyltransferase [Planctomycetota bacterium]
MPSELRGRVLKRLGLLHTPSSDMKGLSAVYRAWCAAVPFDNIRKMIALRTQASGSLPGSDAIDFFEAWLAYGCGGTCWASNNALYTLLRSLGFQARPVAGSMRDVGVINHGSIKVALDRRDWLVDSSMLTNEPLPLGSSVYISKDRVFGGEVEPVDGTHIVWMAVPPHDDGFPCRLLQDPIDPAFQMKAYEASRSQSPFNERIYARRNRPDAMVVVRGPTRFQRSARGVERMDLSREQLCAVLCEEIGISETLVEAWVRSGGLDATFVPFSGPPPAPLKMKAPSKRNSALG